MKAEMGKKKGIYKTPCKKEFWMFQGKNGYKNTDEE